MRIHNEFHSTGQPTALALGYFDGVHLGHRAVIGGAVAYARAHGLAPAVFTFSLDEGLVSARGGDILSLEERAARIAQLGVEHYICPPASSFYGQTPQWFVETCILAAANAKAVFCGADFTFGKDRQGTVEVLRRLCAPLGIQVVVVESTAYQGEKVSSTRIRQALAQGDMPLANALLGQPYSIDFVVCHGKQLGRTFGCPTINQVYPAGLLQPRQGVYASSVEIDGVVHPGATGFGNRPTVDGENNFITAETYIKNFTGDLYGRSVRTTLHKYLWPTRAFGSLDELGAMIRAAADQAEAYLGR